MKATHLQFSHIAAFGLLFAQAAAGASPAGVYALELKQLTPDIYVMRRPDPFRQPVEPNATFIVNETDVVVVEGGGSPLAAENAIRLIRSVTDKPVSVLINTHWHGDHNLGNQLYRDRFPAVRIIGHTKTREHMLGEPMKYVERYPAQLGEYAKALREKKDKGELSDNEQRLLGDLDVYIRELERVVITPPDLTLDSELVLHRKNRTIHVRHLGRGNTDGDLIVWLPTDQVLITGDLVVHPIPYAFGSYPREWLAVLEQLERYPFKLLVPGHGDVQGDRAYLGSLRGLIASVRDQVSAAVAKKLDLAATRKAVDASKFPSEFAQPDAARKSLFDAWWTQPAVRSAWLEATGAPIRQGAADETG